MLVPRNKFGSSLYNVPLLLVLRLFYQASPFEATVQQVSHGRNERDVAQFTSREVATGILPAPALHASLLGQYSVPREPHTIQPFSTYENISTIAWLAKVSASPSLFAHHRLVSLTWTKALASPLSHEFIQFVIEDNRTGHRSRHLTHRHVDGGDSVLLGFDWTTGKDPTQHHALPLPLLSLTFDNQPKVVDFTSLLVEITKRRPEYNLLREMCWWYAEAIFEVAHARYGGRIREWDFAHLRYSFVVRTNVIKRVKLVRHAEKFRRLNMKEMNF
jgi:hypothetical protein